MFFIFNLFPVKCVCFSSLNRQCNLIKEYLIMKNNQFAEDRCYYLARHINSIGYICLKMSALIKYWITCSVFFYEIIPQQTIYALNKIQPY